MNPGFLDEPLSRSVGSLQMLSLRVQDSQRSAKCYCKIDLRGRWHRICILPLVVDNLYTTPQLVLRYARNLLYLVLLLVFVLLPLLLTLRKGTLWTLVSSTISEWFGVSIFPKSLPFFLAIMTHISLLFLLFLSHFWRRPMKKKGWTPPKRSPGRPTASLGFRVWGFRVWGLGV